MKDPEGGSLHVDGADKPHTGKDADRESPGKSTFPLERAAMHARFSGKHPVVSPVESPYIPE